MQRIVSRCTSCVYSLICGLRYAYGIHNSHTRMIKFAARTANLQSGLKAGVCFGRAMGPGVWWGFWPQRGNLHWKTGLPVLSLSDGHLSYYSTTTQNTLSSGTRLYCTTADNYDAHSQATRPFCVNCSGIIWNRNDLRGFYLRLSGKECDGYLSKSWKTV